MSDIERITRNFETVREIPGQGWLNKTTGRMHKSAAHAQKAIKRRRPDSDVHIDCITWEPVTALGSMVVKVITDND